MKGLFVKDCMLMKSQARALLMIMFCGVAMSLSFEPTTVIFYLAVVASMTATGTFGYDEFEHGYSFLFTLPFERKTYVREKYLFCFCSGLLAALIGSIASACIFMIHKQGNPADILPAFGASLLMILLVSSLMIPIRVAFDSEKGKTMQFLVYGILLLAVLGLGGIMNMFGIDLGPAKDFIQNINPAVLVGILCIIVLVILAVSMTISEKVIARKEY
jgi:hypothetical protein